MSPSFVPHPFRDRRHAGRVLAERLSEYTNRSDVIVLALPRGGVPVGFEVASALQAPLDVFVVRKLGVPGREELAMGAVASGGVRFVNEDVVRGLNLPPAAIEQAATNQAEEVARREQLYRDGRPFPDLRDLIVILVDDGLATGSSMRAAVCALRQQRPARIIAAIPVGAADTCRALRSEVDEVICAIAPEPFYAVGQWYEEFSQTADGEVRDLLQRARSSADQRGPAERTRP